MSAFRGMYGMFRADLLLFRFLVFRPLQIACSEPREKLSHKRRGLVYIFDMKDLKRLKSKHTIQRVILLVSSRTQHRHPKSIYIRLEGSDETQLKLALQASHPSGLLTDPALQPTLARLLRPPLTTTA
jgi:hypothetical protein